MHHHQHCCVNKFSRFFFSHFLFVFGNLNLKKFFSLNFKLIFNSFQIDIWNATDWGGEEEILWFEASLLMGNTSRMKNCQTSLPNAMFSKKTLNGFCYYQLMESELKGLVYWRLPIRLSVVIIRLMLSFWSTSVLILLLENIFTVYTRVKVEYNFFGPKSVQNYKFLKLQIITQKDLQ